MQGYATSIEHIFRSGGETLVTTATKILSGPVQFVFNILFAIAFTILAVVATWYVLKWLRRVKCNWKMRQFGRIANFMRRKKRLADAAHTLVGTANRGNTPPVEPTEKSISSQLKSMKIHYNVENEDVFVGHGFSRPETCPKIDIWLNDKLDEPVTGLLDTGADVSVINLDFCLTNKMKIETPVLQNILTVSGDRIAVVGFTWVRISLSPGNILFGLVKLK